jgi:predicted dehydrogenase
MTYGLGLIGAGFIGRPLASHVADHDQLTVTAVADVDSAARDRAGELLGVPVERRFESWEALLRNSDVDGVLVATPPAVREHPIRAAVERGVSVYAEKPLATTAATAARISDVVAAHDVNVGVGFQRRLHPHYAQIRSKQEAARPGLLRGYLGMDWVPGLEDTWKTDPAVPGSGFLLDTGIHLVDVALWISGITPTTVTASVRRHPVYDIDIRAAVIVRGDDGEIINLVLDGEASTASEEMQVSSETPAEVYRDGFLDGDGMLGEFEGERTQTSRFEGATDNQDGDAPGTKADAIASLLAGEETRLATVSEASTATAVCEAVLESARAGEEVPLSRLTGGAQFDG